MPERVFKVRYTREGTVSFDSDENPTDMDILSEAEGGSCALVDWEITEIKKRG